MEIDHFRNCMGTGQGSHGQRKVSENVCLQSPQIVRETIQLPVSNVKALKQKYIVHSSFKTIFVDDTILNILVTQICRQKMKSRSMIYLSHSLNSEFKTIMFILVMVFQTWISVDKITCDIQYLLC